jgi:hypothetical protein
MGKNKPPEAVQIDRFIETARALGCDEDKDKFEAQLGKIVAQKSPPKKDVAPKKIQRKKKRDVR